MSDIDRFVERCASIVGQYEKDDFLCDQDSSYVHLSIESPIEQLFYTAFRTLVRINGFEAEEWKPGVHVGASISPQYEIGRYRVDFLATFSRWPDENGNQKTKHLIVECDSQAFHERTEKERRYEKARDRYLQLKDLKIFHFTGKEIILDPFKVASEVLIHLTDLPLDIPVTE